jgi:hypothetical protein
VHALSALHPITQIVPGLNLQALTISVGLWANELRGGLDNEGYTDAAEIVAGSPPSASRTPTTADCDRLKAYVEARMSVIRDLLGGGS